MTCHFLNLLKKSNRLPLLLLCEFVFEFDFAKFREFPELEDFLSPKSKDLEPKSLNFLFCPKTSFLIGDFSTISCVLRRKVCLKGEIGDLLLLLLLLL